MGTSAERQIGTAQGGSVVDSWDYPAPCRVAVAVEPQQIDAYGRVNNAVYLTWFDQVAWFHSNTLGVPLEMCIALRRGL